MGKQDRLIEEELSNSSNIIGKGTMISGDVETFGNIRIEGKLKGNVKTKSKIALGQSSIVEGDITAQNAEISGEVVGKVLATETVILRPTAVVHGDIVTNKLIVESGATFNGGCKMGASKEEIVINKDFSVNGITREDKQTA